MSETGQRFERTRLPSWGLIATLVVVGVSLVGFGNADRLFWRLTSQGAQLPGLVTEVRSYRLPDSPNLIYVPKVAFRDPKGHVRIMEPQSGSIRFGFEPEQAVLVDWDPTSETITIDLPLQRKPFTSVALWLLTAVGLASWARGIWLILRRIILKSVGMRQRSENI